MALSATMAADDAGRRRKGSLTMIRLILFFAVAEALALSARPLLWMAGYA